MLNVFISHFVGLTFGTYTYFCVPARQHTQAYSYMRAQAQTHSSIAIKTIYVRSYVCHKVVET